MSEFASRLEGRGKRMALCDLGARDQITVTATGVGQPRQSRGKTVHTRIKMGLMMVLFVSSTISNAFRTFLAPATQSVGGFWLCVMPLQEVALVWAARIGVNRAVGHGLKYPTGFEHTYLSGTPGYYAMANELTGDTFVVGNSSND